MLLRQRQWKGEKQPAVPSDGVPAFGVCGYQIIQGHLQGIPDAFAEICMTNSDCLSITRDGGLVRGNRAAFFFVHFPDNRRSTGEFYRFFGLRGPQSLK
jgi:hypothetical protein